LLILKWNPGRQRNDMPVDMAVPLLASKTQDIEALGLNRPANRFSDFANDLL
jgi:hypothetical protein